MKFKINKEILLENLNNVGRGLSSRNIIPILNGILFELNEDGLFLTATDNEITIRTFISNDHIESVDSYGSIVIYGRFILDILRKLPNESIVIEEVDGLRSIISTKSSKYNLNCYSVNDYPKIKFEDSKAPIRFTAGNFKEMVNQTVFATSQQETKPLLTGINIKIIGNILECVATDSYRLAKKCVKFNNFIDNNINFVIPARNISEFIKSIDDDEEVIELHPFSNKVLFKYKNMLFLSSLLDGNYPNTDQIVPQEFLNIIRVNTNQFYNILDRASILTIAKDKNIVSLETHGNNLVITSSSIEIGKIEEVMNINVLKGEDVKISFNVKFMMEAIRSYSDKEINLYFNGDTKSIFIRSNDDGDLIQLIQPIKMY